MHHVKKRIFVGNLPSRLSNSDVEKKLGEFGNVLSVELKKRTDNEGNILSSFAFVDIETNLEKLDSCFQRFETELWCNHKVKLELAKESFLERLKREQNAAKSQNISSGRHINEQSDSFNSIYDKCSTPYSEKKHSLISKDSKSPRDMVEHAIKKTKRKTESTCMDRNRSDEVKTNGEHESFQQRVGDLENREDAQILSDEESDKETCRRYGSLPMFSGTKNLNDLGDSCIRENLSSSQRKRNLHSLSSPEKRSNSNHLSFSSEKIIPEIKNDAIYSRSVEPHESFGKKIDRSGDRTRKKPENSRIAEEKRLNALEERNKALSLQKEAVKKALSSVDMKTISNKRIVFDLDEENEEPDNFQTEINFPHYANAEASKHKLFDDSSDDEDPKDVKKEEFKIKPQFEGRKGQKLLEIQSRYGNDSRFNLDERFYESEDENLPDQEEGDEEDFNAEKQHQLNILQEMLGVDVFTKMTKKIRPPDKRNHFEMVRFDPSNPEHSKYVVKEENVEAKKKKEAEKDGEMKGKKRKREEEKVIEENPVPTSTKRFYVVSDLLKESLKNEQNDTVAARKPHESPKGFSLLKAFGSAPSDDDEEEEVESYTSRPIKKKGLRDWDKNPFKYDSSDEEEEDKKTFNDLAETSLDNPVDTSTLKKENERFSTELNERFHFKNEDPRLQEGLAFFRIEKTFEEMQEGFQEKRADLKLIVKAKVRNNKRKKLPFRRKLGGLRRPNRNSSFKARS